MLPEELPEDARQPLNRILEQLHATLVEILQQQNERISRLEGEPNQDVHVEGNELVEVGGNRPADIENDSTPKELQQGPAAFNPDDFAMVMSVYPDPGQALLTNIAAATSWHSTTITHYIEPSPLPFISTYNGGLLVHLPEWKDWFRSNCWIPADRRLPLPFDVDHLNQCATLNQALSKYKSFNDFDEGLCESNGRLLIIDNNTLGENRVYGNLVEKRGWRRGFLSDRYTMHCDNDGSRLIRVINEQGLQGIPPMTWTTIDDTITGARPIAPWRRLIIIEGLVGVRPKDPQDGGLDYHAPDLWSDIERVIPISSSTVKMFLYASTQAFSSRDGYSFQYAWFFCISKEQIQRWKSGTEDSKGTPHPEYQDVSWIRLLKIGKLYGSSTTMIGRDAYHFKMIYAERNNNDSGQMNNYWSAMIFRRPSWRSNNSMLPIFHAQLQLLSNSNEALTCIIDDSTELVDYIGSLLDIGDEVLLDPQQHDELLFDDETFSRSRTYWWTLNMLTAMQQSLTETLAVRQEIWDTVLEPLLPMDEWPLGAPEVVRKDKTLVKELTKLQDRISQQHRRAEALRGGLFNASGVVESRASTRLGEIVKLLTYVSIFYLPLSFSTSLWSTTDQIRGLDTAILFGVMIALGVLTYMVVFNLNSLTQAIYRQYEAAKKPWLRKMRDENKPAWKDRAEQYRGFKVKRFDTSPSEWLFIWYVLTWPIRYSFRSKEVHIAQHESMPKPPRTEMDKATENVKSSKGGWLKDHPPFPPSEDVHAFFQYSPSSYRSPPRSPKMPETPMLTKLFPVSKLWPSLKRSKTPKTPNSGGNC